jgi:glycosyltransferase involved in cell wall biosynthesis
MNISKKEMYNIKKYLFWKTIFYIPFSVYIDHNFILKKNNYNEIGPLKITTLSRLVKEKHLDFYINVCKKIIQNGYKIIFDIYGDGPQKLKLNNLIRSLNLENYVTLKGQTSNPMEVLTYYDFFFATMVEDSTGIAGIQAASLNLPIMGYQTVKNYKSEKSEIISSNDIDLFTKEFIRLTNNKEKNDYVEGIIKNYYNNRNFSNYINKYSLFLTDIMDDKIKANYD